MNKKHIGSSLASFLDDMEIREETELLATAGRMPNGQREYKLARTPANSTAAL